MAMRIEDQAALSQLLTAGGTAPEIELAPGRYSLPRIERKVTIRGSRDVILEGGAGEAVVAVAAGGALSLKGVTVEPAADGVGVASLGQASVELEEVAITGGEAGIRALGASRVRAVRCQVLGASKQGVDVHTRSRVELAQVTIEVTKGNAVVQRDEAALRAKDCTIRAGEKSDAVRIARGYDVELEGCTVAGGYRGVFVAGGRGGRMRDCVIEGSVWPCLLVDEVIHGRPVDPIVAERCVFRGSVQSAGILASDVPSGSRPVVVLEDCTSTANAGWGVVAKAGAMVSVVGGQLGGGYGGARALSDGVVKLNAIATSRTANGPVSTSPMAGDFRPRVCRSKAAARLAC